MRGPHQNVTILKISEKIYQKKHRRVQPPLYVHMRWLNMVLKCTQGGLKSFYSIRYQRLIKCAFSSSITNLRAYAVVNLSTIGIFDLNHSSNTKHHSEVLTSYKSDSVGIKLLIRNLQTPYIRWPCI